MEVLSEKIKRFLTIGYGSGYGSGYGYGSGSGSGYGSGYGYGYRDGYVDGYGSGYGDGDGLISFNHNPVNYIDDIHTVILNVHGNLAKGFTINNDLTTRECFVVKGHNLFAHGDTAKEAEDALQEKIMESMDPEEKIDLFLKEFKSGIKYPAEAFFTWHNKLTGSCEFGRRAFVRDHGIDLEHGTYTVEEFCEITKDAYGGDIIKQLEERIKENV